MLTSTRTSQDIIKEIIEILNKNDRPTVFIYRSGEIPLIQRTIDFLSRPTITASEAKDQVEHCIKRYNENVKDVKKYDLEENAESFNQSILFIARKAGRVGKHLELDLKSLIEELTQVMLTEEQIQVNSTPIEPQDQPSIEEQIQANSTPIEPQDQPSIEEQIQANSTPIEPQDQPSIEEQIKANSTPIETQDQPSIEKKIQDNLTRHNYPEGFNTACRDAIALALELKNNGQLSNSEYDDFMNKTNNLILNPKEYRTFRSETKNYQMIAGGQLSAYVLLIAGWAAKILSFGLLGDAWIKRANEQIDFITTTEELVSASTSLTM